MSNLAVIQDENLTDDSKNLPVVEEVVEEVEPESEEVVEEEVESEEPSDKEQTFMNPNELPKELLPSFKAMQKSFTRAMQRVAGDRDKIAMYDQLMVNPQQAIEQLAKKAGVQIQQPVNQQTGEEVSDTDTTKWIRKIVQDTLAPTIATMKAEQANIKAQTAIAYLNENHPDWYLYEDIMSELIKKHPSMRDDLDSLYTLSKTGAEKAAVVKKAASKTERVITQTSKGRGGVVTPTKAKTVQEAFDIAKKQLGIVD